MAIEIKEYPGRLETPAITASPFMGLTLEDLLKRSRAARERELARRKTLRGRIGNWVSAARRELARMIDPC